MVEQFAVILVDSTSHAMRVENLLYKGGIPSKLIPVPRHLSSDCGVCVRIALNNVESAKKLLEINKLSFKAIEMLDK